MRRRLRCKDSDINIAIVLPKKEDITQEHMNKAKLTELEKYWSRGAADDYNTMLSLYRTKHYPQCLFFAHLVLEKQLKAHVVQVTGDHAPHVHNLVHLLKLSKISLSDEDTEYLADANQFNIATRYPDYKYDFHKRCTKAYTKRHLDKIKKLYKKLCQRKNIRKKAK